MLKSNKFNISPELYNSFRDVLREVAVELKTKEGLYSQTLGEYLNQLGKVLFTGDFVDEAEMVSFMAPITEYIINKEIMYSEDEELE